MDLPQLISSPIRSLSARRTRTQSRALRRFQMEVVGALLVAFVMAYYDLHAMRGTTFFADEWPGLAAYSWSPSVLLRNQAGHNFYFSTVLWNATVALFGTTSYLPYRVLGLLCNMFAAAAVLVYGWKRLSYGAGILLAVVALTLGSSFHTVLWVSAALGLLSIGFLVFSLLILEGRNRWGEVAVVVMLIAAIGVGGYGLLALFGVTVEILLRRQWRRLWIPAIPSVLYLAWREAYHVTIVTGGSAGVGTVPISNLTGATSYILQQLTATVACLAGQVATMGPALTVGMVALVAWMVRGGRADRARIAVLALSPVFFWFLLSIVRGQDDEFGAPRYVAFGALPIALILLEAVRSKPRTRAFQATAVAAVCFCALANFNQLESATASFRYQGGIDLATQTALEMAANYVPAALAPPSVEGSQLIAGQYLEVARRFGSNAPSPAQLATEADGPLGTADAVLLEAGAIRFHTVHSASALCSTLRTRAVVPVAAGSSLIIRDISGPTSVFAYRFYDTNPSTPLKTLSAGTITSLDAEPDAKNFSSPIPWEITIIGGRFEACG